MESSEQDFINKTISGALRDIAQTAGIGPDQVLGVEIFSSGVQVTYKIGGDASYLEGQRSIPFEYVYLAPEQKQVKAVKPTIKTGEANA